MIYNEDCLEGMKKIETGSVDMILTDPPFGTTDCPFDKRLPFAPLWEQFLLIRDVHERGGIGIGRDDGQRVDGRSMREYQPPLYRF